MKKILTPSGAPGMSVRNQEDPSAKKLQDDLRKVVIPNLLEALRMGVKNLDADNNFRTHPPVFFSRWLAV